MAKKWISSFPQVRRQPGRQKFLLEVGLELFLGVQAVFMTDDHRDEVMTNAQM